MKQAGYGVTLFTNTDSPKKGHGNFYEPLTPKSKATLQNFVETYGEAFIQDVARYRDLTPDYVAEEYGQGDVLRAGDAIENGMIDRIVPSFSKTYTSLAESSGAANRARAIESRLLSSTSSRLPKLQTSRPMFILPAALNGGAIMARGELLSA